MTYDDDTMSTTAPPRPGETTSTASLAWVLRAGVPDDHNFIKQTWLKCYRNSAFARAIRDSVFFAFHHPIVERILARPGTAIRVACLPDAPEVILGYLVHEGGVVHWVYTKGAFRRLGIASRLAEGLPADFAFTHRTTEAEAMLRKYPNATYNPYAI